MTEFSLLLLLQYIEERIYVIKRTVNISEETREALYDELKDLKTKLENDEFDA
jgi:hypothetical protein